MHVSGLKMYRKRFCGLGCDEGAFNAHSRLFYIAEFQNCFAASRRKGKGKRKRRELREKREGDKGHAETTPDQLSSTSQVPCSMATPMSIIRFFESRNLNCMEQERQRHRDQRTIQNTDVVQCRAQFKIAQHFVIRL